MAFLQKLEVIVVDFLDVLESEYEGIDKHIEYVLEFLEDGLTEGELTELLSEAFVEDSDELLEALVKRVSSDGTIRKTLSRKIRKRRATLTTGISKADLKLRARKAARTRKRSPGVVRKSIRKRRKAMRRRKQMGIR